jgi:4-diphosphocytidyl-2-C-methyl-D-erythritol kinase
MLSLKSPAKINLFLRILRARPDGYHELASLFQTIDLCDTLYLQTADADTLTCTDPCLPTDHTNLVSKAVQLFRRKTGITSRFAIHLQKKIPQQAGLGGGSSNAATALWGLNFLSGRPAAESELAAWGAEIGSDISFFLSQGTAYCTGRGEIVRSLLPLKSLQLCIVKPPQGLSTPQVYGKLNLKEVPDCDPELALASFLSGSSDYFNDLEQPAFEVMPALAVLKQHLKDCGFSDVLMSGSGSSFFCIGNGDLSHLSNCLIFPVKFANREQNSWY